MRKRVPLLASVVAALSFMTNTDASRVLAADLDSYQLTVPQTLGLYGDSLQAVYFDGAATTPVQFDYIGSTADISALEGYPSGYGTTYLSAWYAMEYPQFNRNMFQAYTYLIYKWDTNTLANPSGSSFSIKLEQSLNVTAYGFKTSLFFGTNRASMYTPYTYGQYTFYGDDLQTVVGNAVVIDNDYYQPNRWGILRTIPRPVTNANSGTYIFGNDYAMTFSGLYAFLGHTTDGYDPVTIGSSYFATKDEGTVAAVETYNNVGGAYTFYDSAVYLLVQCPILYGDYILPEPEAPEGVDLSQIEEYLEQQGADIANISEEATVQTRQLLAILAKLEQIYQAMQSGGFNPSLNPQAAQTLPPLDWSAQQSAIASGTLSSQDIENMTPAAGMLTDSLGDILDASGLTLFAVGLISLCAAGWFLTQGRG